MDMKSLFLYCSLNTSYKTNNRDYYTILESVNIEKPSKILCIFPLKLSFSAKVKKLSISLAIKYILYITIIG